jgi:hypothetical protein
MIQELYVTSVSVYFVPGVAACVCAQEEKAWRNQKSDLGGGGIYLITSNAFDSTVCLLPDGWLYIKPSYALNCWLHHSAYLSFLCRASFYLLTVGVESYC